MDSTEFLLRRRIDVLAKRIDDMEKRLLEYHESIEKVLNMAIKMEDLIEKIMEKSK